MDIKIVSIAGGSASGKSSIVKFLSDYFTDDLLVIGHDNYYKPYDDIEFEERAKLNYDTPSAFDTEMFYNDLVKIKSGNEVDIPTYDYTKHTRSSETLHIIPKKIILIEGILVLYERRLRDITDTKIYVDADSDVRLQRRILRDTKERARSIESVLNQYIYQVKPMHEKYVEPSKKYADIVIPGGAKNTRGIEIIIKHLEHLIEE